MLGSIVIDGFGSPSLVLGGFGGTQEAGVVVTEPNPAETVFTLGFGGATWGKTLAPGFNLALAAGLLNNGQVVSYPSSATLDASFWAGAETATIFNPAVAWDTANGGYASGRITLAFAASQTVGLDGGDYQLQIGVTTSGVRSLAYLSTITVVLAPGSTTIGQSWCSYEDMILYSDVIQSLKNRQNYDGQGFITQRANATAKVSRMIVLRYIGRPGYTVTRGATYNPITGFDVPDPTATTLTKAQVTNALNGGGLILEQRVREIVARMAVAEVLRRQLSNKEFMNEAIEQETEAERLFGIWSPQLDTTLSGSGIPTHEIQVDCIVLPTGAAP